MRIAFFDSPLPIIFLLFTLAWNTGFSQSENAIPLNSITPETLQGIRINGLPFLELMASKGDEGEIAALCQCDYSVMKSEDPDFPWAAYTLFEEEDRFSVSFGENQQGGIEITSLELLGSKASITLKKVTLTRGSPIEKLGPLNSRPQYNDGPLHFALFPGGNGDTFFHIDFEPNSGEIKNIGYIAPF